MAAQFISHDLIDIAHWDKCIEKASNGSIFAYSWYLNHASPGWSALADDDYKFIMPLPDMTLKGVHSLQTPALIQHLGIYSTLPITHDVCQNFLSSIPSSYKYVKLCLNKLNLPHSNGLPLYKNYQLAYELDLIRNYSSIQQNYDSETKVRLASNSILRVNIVSGIQLLDLLHLNVGNEQYSSQHISDTMIKQLRNIGIYILRINAGEILGAYDQNNNLCAAVFFISSHNKAHMLFYAQTKYASKGYVIEQIIDYFIKRQSEKNLTFCELSHSNCLPYLAAFGAVQTKYPLLEINHLPWYIKPLT